MARAAVSSSTPAHAQPLDQGNQWTGILAGMGLLDGAPQGPLDEVYLWPENVDTWAHWCALQTQWRTGMAGATGLDYAAVRAWLEAHCDSPERVREHWAGIREAEAAVLEVWADQRAQRDSHPPPLPH